MTAILIGFAIFVAISLLALAWGLCIVSARADHEMELIDARRPKR